jgi:predicted ArsR family transcriptional regulator
MKLIMETLSSIKHKILTLFKMNFEIVMSDGEEIVENDDISLEDIADALADLTLEVKVLEAKVQRLSELRDTLGYVPIYENGGKQ